MLLHQVDPLDLVVFSGRRKTRRNAGGQGLQPPVSGRQGLGGVGGMHGGEWLKILFIFTVYWPGHASCSCLTFLLIYAPGFAARGVFFGALRQQ
jgi:hypothetical protein